LLAKTAKTKIFVGPTTSTGIVALSAVNA